jgi:hypothetical protein
MKTAIIALATLSVAAATASAVDYASQIVPIFRAKCYECHHTSKKVKGDVDLADDKMPESIGAGKHIVPSEPKKSTMLIYCTLPDDDEDVMPPKGKNRLSPTELKMLETWITEGASLTGGGAAPATAMPAAAGGALKWTNTEGKTIEAEFMGLEGDSVLLKIPSTGVTHILALSKLSAESQAQAKAAVK